MNEKGTKQTKSNNKIWLDGSIRNSVFRLLDKTASLSTRRICRLLGLSYLRYRNYIYNLRWQWKSNYRDERGSKCSSVHGWRGWCYVPGGLDRGAAVDRGWHRTESRNRFLLWRNRKLGRLMWFETDRESIWVRKPASLRRASQLIANAFMGLTGLITDIRVLERVLKGIRFKGAHYVFETGQRLPRKTIPLFAESNGVIVKVGDVSHPSAIELEVFLPDWAERMEYVLEQFLKMVRPSQPMVKHSVESSYIT